MTDATRDDLITFARLFTGNREAYGVSAGGVRRGEVTLNLYRRHLAGSYPIGILPMQPDNTVRFCAIDLDRPDFELATLMASMIPGQSWIERSRSGNAHIWVFFNGSCPAWAARGVLKHVTEALGERTVEVFPKQEKLLPGMVGNYINLPWAGDERPVVGPEIVGRALAGDPFEAAEFHWWVNEAYATRQDPQAWVRQAEARGFTPTVDRDSKSEFGEQGFLHECAVHILKNKDSNPLTPGSRQAVIFHVSKMLLNWNQLDEDEAFELVEELNEAAVEPLSEAELRSAFRNAASGRYTYTGCDDPLMADYVSPTCPFAH